MYFVLRTYSANSQRDVIGVESVEPRPIRHVAQDNSAQGIGNSDYGKEEARIFFFNSHLDGPIL